MDSEEGVGSLRLNGGAVARVWGGGGCMPKPKSLFLFLIDVYSSFLIFFSFVVTVVVLVIPLASLSMLFGLNIYLSIDRARSYRLHMNIFLDV